MLTLRQDFFAVNRFSPLPHLGTDLGVFIHEWKACRQNRKRPTDDLFRYLDPHIKHWVRMFKDPRYPKDIAFSCLVSMLEVPDPIETTLLWTKYNSEDLYTLISLVYLEVLRNRPPKEGLGSTPYTMCHSIWRAALFKLEHLIRDWYRNTKVERASELVEPLVAAPEPNTLLNDLLLDIKNDSYHNYYLITLFLSDMDRYDLHELTGTTSTFVYLWRAINEYKEGDSREPEDC